MEYRLTLESMTPIIPGRKTSMVDQDSCALPPLRYEYRYKIEGLIADPDGVNHWVPTWFFSNAPVFLDLDGRINKVSL